MNLITNGWKSQVTLRYGKLVYFATTTKKHCHCQFYIFSKLGHEIFNCHSFDSFFTHFCIPVVQGWLFNPKTQWFCFTHWSSTEIVSTIERQGTHGIVIVKGRLPGWLQDNLAFSTELMMLIGYCREFLWQILC